MWAAAHRTSWSPCWVTKNCITSVCSPPVTAVLNIAHSPTSGMRMLQLRAWLVRTSRVCLLLRNQRSSSTAALRSRTTTEQNSEQIFIKNFILFLIIFFGLESVKIAWRAAGLIQLNMELNFFPPLTSSINKKLLWCYNFIDSMYSTWQSLHFIKCVQSSRVTFLNFKGFYFLMFLCNNY